MPGHRVNPPRDFLDVGRRSIDLSSREHPRFAASATAVRDPSLDARREEEPRSQPEDNCRRAITTVTNRHLVGSIAYSLIRAEPRAKVHPSARQGRAVPLEGSD